MDIEQPLVAPQVTFHAPAATAKVVRPPKSQVGKRKARRRARSMLGDLPELPSVNEEQELDFDFQTRASFPLPPPEGFPTKARIGNRAKPAPDPLSAHNGRFRMGLRGLQRELRGLVRSGDGRAYDCVVKIERELTAWLAQSAVFVFGSPTAAARVIDGTPVDPQATPAITELNRSPLVLTWFCPEPFVRKVVHLIARLWDIVSFSKDSATGQRLTYLYRPNVVAPNTQAIKGGNSFLPTPPTTDFETSSFSGSTDSEWEFEDGDETLTQDEQDRLNNLVSLQRVVSLADSSEDADSEGTDDLADSVQSLTMLT